VALLSGGKRVALLSGGTARTATAVRLLVRDDARLSEGARAILKDGANELVWSVASSWEIAVKLWAGKLQGVEVLPVGHDG
jgi:PIN domain nuclease of toxin-antitoxin system